MPNYLCDPEKIEQETFDKIREQTDLDGFTSDEKQIVLHMIRACGDPALAQQIRFSAEAIEVAKKSIKNYANVLYDFETVQCSLDESLLYQEPMCFANKATTISQAKANKQTRAMTAVSQWKNYINDSIVIFGQSGSGLIQLLELVKAKEFERPALIIATPSGFINSAPAKQLLIDSYAELQVEYITLTGTVGSSIVAAAVFNGLLKIQKGSVV